MPSRLSPELEDFLKGLRRNPLWKDLLALIQEPQPRSFNPKDEPVRTVSDWIYQSGRLDEYNAIMRFLDDRQSRARSGQGSVPDRDHD